jgi:hypothetical protein
MKHQIDLHGLNHNEALLYTEDALLRASLYPAMVFTIITGNSPQLQRKIIEQVLTPHKFPHYIPFDNPGTIIVTEDKL